MLIYLLVFFGWFNVLHNFYNKLCINKKYEFKIVLNYIFNNSKNFTILIGFTYAILFLNIQKFIIVFSLFFYCFFNYFITLLLDNVIKKWFVTLSLGLALLPVLPLIVFIVYPQKVPFGVFVLMGGAPDAEDIITRNRNELYRLFNNNPKTCLFLIIATASTVGFLGYHTWYDINIIREDLFPIDKRIEIIDQLLSNEVIRPINPLELIRERELLMGQKLSIEHNLNVTKVKHTLSRFLPAFQTQSRIDLPSSKYNIKDLIEASKNSDES
jgi:hypothetical protein